MFKGWKNLAKALRQYWQLYGGTYALLTSPYLFLAAVFTAITAPFLIYQTSGHKGVSASEIAISALPNLLGFSVGALAIVLAFSSSAVFERLAEKGDPKSFFITMTANLTHFILVQVIALVCAMTTKIVGQIWLEIITAFLLFYAVLVTLAAGIQLFLAATIYNIHAGLNRPPTRQQKRNASKRKSARKHN